MIGIVRLRTAGTAQTLALACAMLVGTPAGAAPAHDGLRVEAALGISDTFRPGRWTPVTVTLENRGADVSGHLEVLVTAGDEFRGDLQQVTHRRRLELTRDARKRFHFTVYPDSLARPLVVRAVSGGRMLAEQRVDLRRRFTAERLMLVLSRDADLDYLNDPGGKALRVLYPHPELLPEHWLGYDAVAAVIAHGVSLEEMSARQYEALRKWLAAGGTLAVSGGPDYSLLRTPRLAALLPAAPSGVRRIDDVRAASAALGVALDPARPLSVNRVGAVRGTVRARAGDAPLVLERPFGLGKVLYLTFDIAREPFDRLPAMRDAWPGILRLPDPPATRARDDASPVPALIEARASDFPSHATVLLFLGLYLTVLLVGYRLAPEGRAARRLAPLATWAAPLLFAPAAWALFGPLLFERGETVAVASIVEPLGASPYARVRADIGIYSSRRGAPSLEYDGMEPALQPPEGSRFAQPPADWVLGEDARRSAVPEDARAFVLHLLEGRDVIAFDLEAAIATGNAHPRLIVRNDSGRTLEDAWLIWDGSAWPLGTIAGDARVERTLDADPFALESRRDEWWDVLERHSEDAAAALDLMRPLIAREAARRDAGAYPGHGHALLLARTASPLRPSGDSARWQRAEFALVLLRFTAPPARREGDLETLDRTED